MTPLFSFFQLRFLRWTRHLYRVIYRSIWLIDFHRSLCRLCIRTICHFSRLSLGNICHWLDIVQIDEKKFAVVELLLFPPLITSWWTDRQTKTLHVQVFLILRFSFSSWWHISHWYFWSGDCLNTGWNYNLCQSYCQIILYCAKEKSWTCKWS